MATEKLKFKLELYATMWDKPPHAEILINDKSHFNGGITGTEDKPNILEFEQDMEAGKQYDFIINRSGKGKNQQVVNDKGYILKDQLLPIKKIENDAIVRGPLVYDGVSPSQYTEPWATQPRNSGNERKKTFKNVTQMGHIGELKLTFVSPFYMWLLENLY